MGRKNKRMNLDQNLARIKNKKNREYVRQFIEHQVAKGLVKERRIEKYCCVLKNFSEWMNKDFKEANEKDLTSIGHRIETNKNYTAWTKHDYKSIIRRMYKWLEGDDEDYPKKTRVLKPNLKNLETVSAKDILSYDEVVKIIEAAPTIRNKAALSILYETGIRVGELLQMKISDIKISEHMIKIIVDGKTGERSVFVRAFRKHLIDWLNTHHLEMIKMLMSGFRTIKTSQSAMSDSATC